MPGMGRGVRFRGAKNTPKKLERELLDRSRRLGEDPKLLIPECDGECRRCEFEKLLKKMKKVANYADDPDRLIALASKGDHFVRAYAAALSLNAAEKIPYLGTAKLPTGEVSYAVRGKVDNKMLIGAQHFTDPELRLLLYWDIARERDLHIYTLPDRTVCSSAPKAPKAYVDEMLRTSPYKSVQEAGTSLEIEWISANETVRASEERLQSRNLLDHLASRIAAIDRFDDFKVVIRHDFNGVDASEWKDMPISPSLLERYKKGAIDDRALLNEHIKEKREMVGNSGKVVFLVGDALHTDPDTFLAALRGSSEEMRAISTILKASPKAVVLEGDRASEAIAELWEGNEMELLASVSDKETAEMVLAKDLPPAQAVAEASRRYTETGILSDLPSYHGLGEVASFADGVAREYKVRGGEDAARSIERLRPSGHRQRAVARGFLIALGDTGGWQFSKEEEEFGRYLSTFAKELMMSVGEEYDGALRNLVTASGSNEKVPELNQG